MQHIHLPARRIVAWLVMATTIVAIAVTAHLIVSDASAEKIVAIVVDRIEKTTGTHVDVGDVRLDWGRRHVELGPITVIAAGGSRMLSAASVRFDIAPRSWFSRRIEIDN